jgi:hypothetical protein
VIRTLIGFSTAILMALISGAANMEVAHPIWLLAMCLWGLSFVTNLIDEAEKQTLERAAIR